jgi:hypothetical protein
MNKIDCYKHADSRTYLNTSHINEMNGKLTKYHTDLKWQDRINKHLCKHCFYINNDRLAGQAFTQSNCQLCNKEMLFPTTNTDYYCDECAIELNICKHCGARMD